MSASLSPGSNFGRYRLISQPGSGGMATVYRAWDYEQQQEVALKVLHPHLASEPGVMQRFLREAEISQHLQHPGIVPIYDSGKINGKPYLVLKYMSGGSLASRFKESQQVSLKATARLLKDIAAALSYAHERGVVHRDLKLENILLDENNRPALSDFGIARIIAGTRLTMTGEIIGTPLYMSPEQINGRDQEIDYRSDLYSLAVMAYLMATGFHPFTGDVVRLLHQHLNMTPPPASEVKADLPEKLDAVLARGMAKNPDERYMSARDFAEDFAAAIAEKSAVKTHIHLTLDNPVEPQLATQALMSRPPEPRPMWRKALLPAGLTAGALVVMASLMTAAAASRQIEPTLDRNVIVFEVAAGLTATADSWTHTPAPSVTALPTRTSTPTRTPTQTTTPTLTRTPTNTPSPTHVPGVFAKVSRPIGIDLVEGPGNQYARSTFLATDTELELIGRTGDNIWLEVIEPGGTTGWVAAMFVDATPDVIAALKITFAEAVTPNTRVPLTATPLTNSVILPTAVPLIMQPDNQNQLFATQTALAVMQTQAAINAFNAQQSATARQQTQVALYGAQTQTQAAINTAAALTQDAIYAAQTAAAQPPTGTPVLAPSPTARDLGAND